jgi:bifunctional DNA primase/polymerase-like protein
VDAIFQPGCNIGLLTGAASAGLVDVDCDTIEAQIAATTLLPQTPMAHGRTDGREIGRFTHYWYQIVGDLPRTEKFAWREQTPRAARHTVIQTTMLIELRADGCQTMVPPSVHPNGGGWLRWGGGRVEPLEPTRVMAATLRQAVARTASAALLARYWPAQGSRDEAALALAGWLVKAGWTDDEVETFVIAVARAAQDEEWKRRAGKAAHTRETIAAGRPVMGVNALAERLRGGPAYGAMVVTLVARWLGLTGSHLAGALSTAAVVAKTPVVSAFPHGHDWSDVTTGTSIKTSIRTSRSGISGVSASGSLWCGSSRCAGCGLVASRWAS